MGEYRTAPGYEWRRRGRRRLEPLPCFYLVNLYNCGEHVYICRKHPGFRMEVMPGGKSLVEVVSGTVSVLREEKNSTIPYF